MNDDFTEPISQLTNWQREFLMLFNRQVSEDDLQNIRVLIGKYLAQRLTGLADQAWQGQGWTAQTMYNWLNEEN